MTDPDPDAVRVAADAVQDLYPFETSRECIVAEQAAALRALADAGFVVMRKSELDDMNTSIVALAAPWAVEYARDHCFPPNHLHAKHYDILAKAGARMTSFVRWKPPHDR